MAKGVISGVSGTLKTLFAIPTDDPNVWRLKNGSITYENGSTTGIEVEAGYIPHAKGDQGLYVTYFVFRAGTNQGFPSKGDVAMMTCVNGRVEASTEIAQGVAVLLPADMAGADSAVAIAKG